jgi:hypothetical protein
MGFPITENNCVLQRKQCQNTQQENQMNKYEIQTKDEDTGSWRPADQSDGLDSPNEYTDRYLAESEARKMSNRCAYKVPWKIVTV